MTVRVVYQGAPGAFGEEAARRLWPNGAAVGVASFALVVDLVQRGAADAGVLPLENVIAGPVTAALEALESADGIDRTGEVTVPVRLHLLAVAGTTLEMVREIVGHPVALAQCTRATAGYGIPVVAWYDSAGAAAILAKKGDQTRAVVAGDAVRVRYGLTVLASDLQDRSDNATRFVAIRRSAS